MKFEFQIHHFVKALSIALSLTVHGAEPVIYVEAEAGEGTGAPAAMGMPQNRHPALDQRLSLTTPNRVGIRPISGRS